VQRISSSHRFSKWLTTVLPYLAVGIGIFWFQNAWAALLGFHLAIVLSLLPARPALPVTVLFKSHDLRWGLLSVLFSASGGVFLYLFRDSFGIAGDFSTRVARLGLDSSNWIAFIAYFSLVNPFVEEYFWRGYLGSPAKNPYISDFIYAGFHALILAGTMPAASLAFALTTLVLAGWFWRQVARQDQGLLAPVLGHMVVDFLILLAVYQIAI
jgi:membrane protease YdiL (CAAX protease family)